MSYTPPTVVASGETFAQFQKDGISGHLNRLIAAQAATLAPTVAATWTPTGGGASGGLLAAGTYYMVVTESNGFGETTPGPESAQITVAATNIPRITFQALKAGNTSRNVYLGLINGLTGGPYYLYASGIVAATYDLATAVGTNSFRVTPPTANSTGLSARCLDNLRNFKASEYDPVYGHLSQVVRGFLQGDPSDFGGVVNQFRQAHAAFAILATLCAEAGVLIDANPGTVGLVATPIGGSQRKRTWP